jgi:hypothetical protein
MTVRRKVFTAAVRNDRNNAVLDAARHLCRDQRADADDVDAVQLLARIVGDLGAVGRLQSSYFTFLDRRCTRGTEQNGYGQAVAA